MSETNGNGNGRRKIKFALIVEGAFVALAVLGAVPRFEYLQGAATEAIKAMVYVAGLFMAGNGFEHLAPNLPALFGRK